jgi:hypothetical protein
MKEIGDHLGHRSSQATKIYAKVDCRSLRQVADLHMADLADTIEVTETLGTKDISSSKLAVLREIANLNIGGVA